MAYFAACIHADWPVFALENLRDALQVAFGDQPPASHNGAKVVPQEPTVEQIGSVLRPGPQAPGRFRNRQVRHRSFSLVLLAVTVAALYL